MAAEAPNKPYVTLLTIVAGLLFIGLITHLAWPTWVALAVAVAGLISSWLANMIHKGWMGLAHLLSLVVPNILLSIVYFAILFPIALLSRTLGKKDPLHLKAGAQSLYTFNERSYSPQDLEKPW